MCNVSLCDTNSLFSFLIFQIVSKLTTFCFKLQLASIISLNDCNLFLFETEIIDKLTF